MSLAKAIRSRNSKKIAKILEEGAFDKAELEKSSNNNLLHTCVEAGDPETLEILLNDAEFDDFLYEPNSDDYIPAELAIDNMDKQCLSLLLGAGKDESYRKFNLEEMAVDVSNPEILKTVLKWGGNINRRSQDGSLAHLAIMNDQEGVVRFLLGESETDLTAKSRAGIGLVELCIMIKNSRYLQMVVQSLVDRQNKRGLSPEEKEAICFKDENGKGILHQLAEQGMTTMSGFILRHAPELGIDENLKDANGRTFRDILELQKTKAGLLRRKKDKLKQLRQDLKQKRKAEKEQEKQDAIRREEEMEKVLKRQKVENIKRELDQRNRNGFFFVVCLVLFFVLAYLFIKFKIEYKSDYLIDSQVQIDI